MGLTPSISYTKLVIDAHVVLSIFTYTVLISMQQKRNDNMVSLYLYDQTAFFNIYMFHPFHLFPLEVYLSHCSTMLWYGILGLVQETN